MATTNQKSGGGIILAGLLALLLFAGASQTPAPIPTPGPTTTGVTTTIVAPTTATPTTAKPTTTTPSTVPSAEGYPAQYTDGGRYFSNNASWNQPVSKYGYAKAGSQLEKYANIFWRCAGWPGETKDVDCLTTDLAAYAKSYPGRLPSGISVAFKSYSVPIYKYSGRTVYSGIDPIGTWANPCGGGAKVYQRNDYAAQYNISPSGSLKTGDCVPWNEKWLPGTGNDEILNVVDASTGRVWSMGGVSPREAYGNNEDFLRNSLYYNCTNFGGGLNVAAGFHSHQYPYYYYRTELCGAGYNTYPFGDSGNVWTAGDTAGDSKTIVDRGAGINKLALVTRAVEVDQGKIRHALELSIPSTMFADDETCPDIGVVGPCPTHYCPEVTNPEYPGAGDTCAIMLPPASRVEWSSRTNKRLPGLNLYPATNWRRQRTVPEGLRIAIDPSVNIEAWLDARGFTGAKRRTARIFAEALRDYGAIVAETSGAGISVETDGIRDATPGGSKEIWGRNGITDTGGDYPQGDILVGLITQENIRIINPPPRDPKLPPYP